MTESLKIRIISALWFLFSMFPFVLGGYSFQAIQNNRPILFLILFISSLLSILFSSAMLLIVFDKEKQ